jgi:hypothetical protein
VLKGIVVLKKEEMTGRWRKLCNEELHDFNIFSVSRVIKSRSVILID